MIKDGYYYPYSNQAISVKNALLKEAMVKDIKIKTNSYVKDIKKENDKFLIYTNDDAIICDKLIISTGSRAYPKTGSDGFGYTLSKKLGHKINEVLPALTQLHGKGSYFKDLNGVRARGSATLLENNQVLKEEIGEIQFTNYGISGICIFNLSGLASKGLSKNKKINININFIYDLGIDTKDKFYKFLQEKSKILKDRTISDFLDSFLNYKLTNVILNKSKIDKNSLLNKLTKDEIFKVADNIINFNIEITRTNSFDNAQVCQGGISLSQINISSFESLLMPNLYFTGELLDVNGDCGGYNIAFAVLSGIKAGKEARK